MGATATERNLSYGRTISLLKRWLGAQVSVCCAHLEAVEHRGGLFPPNVVFSGQLHHAEAPPPGAPAREAFVFFIVDHDGVDSGQFAFSRAGLASADLAADGCSLGLQLAGGLFLHVENTSLSGNA